MNFKQWQLPDTQALREFFKASLMLLNLPPSADSHLDPVRVMARVETQNSISRAQLQLAPAMNPILVSVQNDKFWLTVQIPMALVEFN